MSNTVLPKWSRLDNAAKIFSANNSVMDSKVFRFACELEDLVDSDILQFALEKTMQHFPFFNSVMKRGVFWYYLEESDLKPVVQLENETPCRPIYNPDCKNLLFKVFYYGRRISVEAYHVLTDGTGALQFLRTLVYYYLLEKYGEEFLNSLPSLDYDSSEFQKQDDSFQKYYEKPKGMNVSGCGKAYRITAERLSDNRLAIIEGRMSLNSLLNYSRSMGVTITELLTAVFIRSIYQGMSLRDKNKTIAIAIPVNLRGYFPSKTARNFFTTITVGYNFSQKEDSLEAICADIRQSFETKLTKDRIREKMNVFSSLEHNIFIRLLPLFVKNLILRFVLSIVRGKSTASFSNVGRVLMPKEMEKYIRFFDAFTSPNILQACACSFKDNYIISFAGPFKNHDVECAFFRYLTEMGIEVEITTNYAE